METYDLAEAAERSGVDADALGRFVELGIADYARPGEVIVSQAVVEASAEAPLTFREIGPVELKGVSGVMHLHAAAPAG